MPCWLTGETTACAPPARRSTACVDQANAHARHRLVMLLQVVDMMLEFVCKLNVVMIKPDVHGHVQGSDVIMRFDPC